MHVYERVILGVNLHYFLYATMSINMQAETFSTAPKQDVNLAIVLQNVWFMIPALTLTLSISLIGYGDHHLAFPRGMPSQ